MKIEANKKVLGLAGGHAEVARLLGYTDRRSVWPWTSGGAPFPIEHCVVLERHFKKAVTRQELRPDDYWLIWPDLKAPKRQSEAA